MIPGAEQTFVQFGNGSSCNLRAVIGRPRISIFVTFCFSHTRDKKGLSEPSLSIWRLNSHHYQMALAPEIVIGAIACFICSISGAACLYMNSPRNGDCCTPGPPSLAYVRNPPIDFEEVAIMQASQIEQPEAYIGRQRRAAAGRAINGNVSLSGTAAGSQLPTPQAPPPVPNVPQAAPGRTDVFISPMLGNRIYAPNTAPLAMPYLHRHQLRNYPYAGARVL